MQFADVKSSKHQLLIFREFLLIFKKKTAQEERKEIGVAEALLLKTRSGAFLC